ncbi:MAG TPA: hypothetical protein VFM99_11420 [Chitinophagales bacterium]|nr:hypothetical protein [Chitinophagales bacterium]
MVFNPIIKTLRKFYRGQKIAPNTFILFLNAVYIKIMELKIKDLPTNRNSHPPNRATQKIGDAFIDSNDQCLPEVQSTVMSGGFNYLIIRNHTEFKKY